MTKENLVDLLIQTGCVYFELPNLDLSSNSGTQSDYYVVDCKTTNLPTICPYGSKFDS